MARLQKDGLTALAELKDQIQLAPSILEADVASALGEFAAAAAS